MDAVMNDYFYLIPVALALGAAGLGAFLWSLRSGQYDDLDGAAERILFDDDFPLKVTGQEHRTDLAVDAKAAGTAQLPSPPSSASR
jgi:cbb3-type cytochrome oxidase maturation protein